MKDFQSRRDSCRVAGLAVLLTSSFLMTSCARIQAMSRVDPHTIAVYPGVGVKPSDKNAAAAASDQAVVETVKSKDGATTTTTRTLSDNERCSVMPTDDYNGGAINLDCFYFPEDRIRNFNAIQAMADSMPDPGNPAAVKKADPAKADAGKAPGGAKQDPKKDAAPAAAAKADTKAAPAAKDAAAKDAKVPPAAKDAPAPVVASAGPTGGPTPPPETVKPFLQPHGRLTAYARATMRAVDRNRLATFLIKQSDDICTIEMGRLVGNEAMTNVGLSFLTSAFGTAGAIVTGDQAKGILSGLGSLANSTRAQINADVYRNAIATAITRAIEIERDKTRKVITDRFGERLDTYTVDQMVMDVNAYHQVCSFYRGLVLVNEAVDSRKIGPAEQRRANEIAVFDIDARIAALEMQLKSGLDGASETLVRDQIKALRDRQTQLLGAAPPAPAPPAPAVDPGT